MALGTITLTLVFSGFVGIAGARTEGPGLAKPWWYWVSYVICLFLMLRAVDARAVGHWSFVIVPALVMSVIALSYHGSKFLQPRTSSSAPDASAPDELGPSL